MSLVNRDTSKSPGEGSTRSLWMDTGEIAERPALEGDSHADVCVVGAGIAGLTTAYRLVHAGCSVIVLDDGSIGGGETGRTTAHLTDALDDRFFTLEKLHGEDGSRLAAESHARAIDEIESIVRIEGIDCEFERLNGYLFVPPGEDVRVLERELAAAHRAGLADVRISRGALLGRYPLGPCLVFPRQAQFHPLKYLRAIAQAIEHRGGRICTMTHAIEIEDGTPARVETKAGPVVTAGAVVVATNTPVNDRVAIHTKQAAYRTYVIAVPVLAESIAPALYWDTGDPYHYIRLARGVGGDVLIVGGEDHKTGQAPDDERACFASLEAWIASRLPEAGQVAYRWSGQIMEPVDGLAFIGRNPGNDNVYIATGDSGNGMTHGTIAGMLLGDLLLKRENPWSSLYDAGRKPLRAAKEFLKENVNVAAQYADLLKGGELASIDELPRGTGAVIRRGAHKIAAYRDSHGSLHELSAVCPHLGCVVNWNAVESSWDCPCHGSRFAPDGTVLNGPANRGLDPVSA